VCGVCNCVFYLSCNNILGRVEDTNWVICASDLLDDIAGLKPRGETIILFKMYWKAELWCICKRICTQLHMI